MRVRTRSIGASTLCFIRPVGTIKVSVANVRLRYARSISTCETTLTAATYYWSRCLRHLLLFRRSFRSLGCCCWNCLIRSHCSITSFFIFTKSTIFFPIANPSLFDAHLTLGAVELFFGTFRAVGFVCSIRAVFFSVANVRFGNTTLARALELLNGTWLGWRRR